MTNRGFTEAVPLSLSSMAHVAIPLENGVVDGVKQVLQHTLLSCVNYARAKSPPFNWTFRDLGTSPFAWVPREGDEPKDLPPSLSKAGFKHQYHRTAFIYLKASITSPISETEERSYKDWSNQKQILGRVSLLYTTTALMTMEELNGSEKDEDTPRCVLYKVLVEYRTLPPSGKKIAVQAEELSMLSFGGSVDDDVKYGALASLYDPNAKYVLEIFSVRGKKYTFDLMDGTLSDGTVPRMPLPKNSDDPNTMDCFVKSLCVTVSDHDTANEGENAVTRMHLILEGNLRGSAIPPEPQAMAKEIQATFLSLRATPTEMAIGIPSGHALLLDPADAGKVYINGQFITTWGKDPKVGSHGPALFGMDLQSIPYWHGRIFDFDILKQSYSELWQEVLTDAGLFDSNIGGRLLSRLISGRDQRNIKSDLDYDDPYDDDSALCVDDDNDDDDDDDANSHKEVTRVNTDMDCLESQVMQSSVYDPVGISAKALATHFNLNYGDEGFPCLFHEIDWVKDRLPGRQPVVVPQRVINVLRRGGYFDTKRTSDEVWFSKSRPAEKGTDEEDIIQKAIELLNEAGCRDITPSMVVVFSGNGVEYPVQKRGLVRFNRASRQYHVNVFFFSLDVAELQDDMSTDGEGETDKSTLAYLLGLHIAGEHPDGSHFLSYVLKHRQRS